MAWFGEDVKEGEKGAWRSTVGLLVMKVLDLAWLLCHPLAMPGFAK